MSKYLTLEDRIEMEILESGRDWDEIQSIEEVDDIIETYADGVAEDIMDDLGLNSDESFKQLSKLIHDRIVADVNYDIVLEKIDNGASEWLEWQDAKRSAVEAR